MCAMLLRNRQVGLFKVKERYQANCLWLLSLWAYFYQRRDMMAHSVHVEWCICILPLSETSRTLDWNRSI